MNNTRRILLLMIGVCFSAAQLRAETPKGHCLPRSPVAPDQPTTGPGSSDYIHEDVVQSTFGTGSLAFDLFEPASPTPDSAPVVVLLHGYGFTDARAYGDWIKHLARRGNIVIYPKYQDGFVTRAERFTLNSINAIRQALNVLETEGHVAPELDAFSLIGHSAGGVIAANVAAYSTRLGLPSPRVLLLANAADTGFGFGETYNGILDLENYHRIPDDTLILAVLGDGDRIAPDYISLSILQAATSVPQESKEIIEIFSDGYGCPRLNASHLAPGGMETVSSPRTGRTPREARASALQFYGYWKWFDALTDAALYGINREYGLGGGYEQTFMGLWSDGTPVIPAEVIWP